ncbi:MAG: hypothetical protein V1743_01540 [Nanoarchaeota archaeon]
MRFRARKQVDERQRQLDEYNNRYKKKWIHLPKIITAACIAGIFFSTYLHIQRDRSIIQRAAASYNSQQTSQSGHLQSSHPLIGTLHYVQESTASTASPERDSLNILPILASQEPLASRLEQKAHPEPTATDSTYQAARFTRSTQRQSIDLLADNLLVRPSESAELTNAISPEPFLVQMPEAIVERSVQIMSPFLADTTETRCTGNFKPAPEMRTEKNIPVPVTVPVTYHPRAQACANQTTFSHTPAAGEELGAFLLERIRNSNVIVPQSDVNTVLWGGMIDGQQYAGWVEKTGKRNNLHIKKEQPKNYILRIGEPFAYDFADLPERLRTFLPKGTQEQGAEIVIVDSGSTASETLCAYLSTKNVKPKNILYGFMDDVAKDSGYTQWKDLNTIPGGTRLTITPQTREKHVARALERPTHENTLEDVMQAYYPRATEQQKATFTESMEGLSRQALSGSKKELRSALHDSALSILDFYTAVDVFSQRDGIETPQAKEIHTYVTEEQSYKSLAERRLAGEKAADILQEWNAQHNEKKSLSWLYKKTSKHM